MRICFYSTADGSGIHKTEFGLTEMMFISLNSRSDTHVFTAHEASVL